MGYWIMQLSMNVAESLYTLQIITKHSKLFRILRTMLLQEIHPLGMSLICKSLKYNNIIFAPQFARYLQMIDTVFWMLTLSKNVI